MAELTNKAVLRMGYTIVRWHNGGVFIFPPEAEAIEHTHDGDGEVHSWHTALGKTTHAHPIAEFMPEHGQLPATTTAEAEATDQGRAAARRSRKTSVALRRRRRLAKAAGDDLQAGPLVMPAVQGERTRRRCPGVCASEYCRHGWCPVYYVCPLCDAERPVQSRDAVPPVPRSDRPGAREGGAAPPPDTRA